jgi:hypothetical protein
MHIRYDTRVALFFEVEDPDDASCFCLFFSLFILFLCFSVAESGRGGLARSAVLPIRRFDVVVVFLAYTERVASPHPRQRLGSFRRVEVCSSSKIPKYLFTHQIIFLNLPHRRLLRGSDLSRERGTVSRNGFAGKVCSVRIIRYAGLGGVPGV